MKHTTSNGTIEIIKTEIGIQIRFFNRSTMRECGITIPKQIVTSFIRRHFFMGSHETLEVIMENGGVTIIGTTNFGRDIPTSTTVSRSTWDKIEIEMREMI